MRKILINREYKHFKGQKYKVLCIAHHFESYEEPLIYQILIYI